MTERYPSPRALLDKHDLRAKKSWGQNFLGDQAILDEIARLAAPRAGDTVLELGAGLGHLTARLLARSARVIAVERDRDMVKVLKAELGDRITLLEADAARLDYAELAARFAGAPGEAAHPARGDERSQVAKLAVVGNLPYHLTSPILFSILDQVDHVSRAVFLLQREVAERLAAPPGSREWGVLSVLLQRRADVSVERVVPPGAFWPPPKVDSAVLCALLHPPRDPAKDEARLRKLVKAGFAQRRKTLRNALESAHVAERETLLAALATAGIDPGRRGETLTLAEWAALDRALG
jgi:16S rRNA (adenine1518-N6/adenine1519-N6)-dimethyltransferase